MKNIYYRNIFINYLVGCGLKKGTITRMKASLRLFYMYLNGRDVREVKEVDLIDFVKYLRTHNNYYDRPFCDRTIEVYLMTVKSYYLFLYKNDYVLSDITENLEIKQGGNKKIISMFSKDEIGTLLDSISISDVAGQRDRAFFELLYSSGLRVREGLNLELESVNFTERIILVKSGKGSKDRYVPFSETALKFLVKYVNDGRKKQIKTIRNDEIKKYFFLCSDRALTYGIIQKRFSKYLSKCGLNNRGFHIHSIRHSVATHLLEAGAGIRYVQELLGHKEIGTTQIYARPNTENIKKIYRTYHPRENEYYEEIDSNYIKHVEILKKQLLINRTEQIKKKKRLERRLKLL